MPKFRYLLIGFILGFLLAHYWSEDEVKSNPRLANAAPPMKPSRTPSTAKDPLTEIEGIGPAYERALNALDIFTFEQLAAQNVESLAAKMSARVTVERIQREQWIQQARKRAR
jgi:predicted flap endonuclease-1-like 5' DNA nuclease